MNLAKFNINLLSKSVVYEKDKDNKKLESVKGYMLSYVEINIDNESNPYGVANTIFVPAATLPKETYDSFKFLDSLVLTMSLATSISKNAKVLSVLKNDEKLEHQFRVNF
jgi:hypothetical protein